MMVNALLKPIKLGIYELPNRIFMAPMTRSRADNPDNAATPLIAEYYAQRASAGLIISEGSQVSQQSVGTINTPGIYTPAQIEGWKLVTRAVHDKNGHIFCQLWHVGRMSHPDFHGGKLPVAPSAINPQDKIFTPDGFKDTVKPQAITITEIHDITKDFRKAAENAIAAGFDGVEIHAANGYLFHQFFSNCSNIRKDEYGSSRENKARFFFETLVVIGQAIGFDRVGVRLNPSAHGFFGITIDKDTIPTFEYIVERLNDYHNLAYVHFTEPLLRVDDVPYAVKEVAKHFRPRYKGKIIINGGLRYGSGIRVIEDGYADAVAFGKPFISNPDLVERIRSKVDWDIWDDHTFYTTGPKGYTDYPPIDGMNQSHVQSFAPDANNDFQTNQSSVSLTTLNEDKKTARIKVGENFGDFSLKNQKNILIDTAGLKDKKVLLSFHPLAWTDLCAKQMQSLEENYEIFKKLNTVALGLSVDSVPCKKAWADSLGLEKLDLLSDFWPHGEIASRLGIFIDEFGFSERANIILDEQRKAVFVKVYPIKELPDVKKLLEFLKT